MNIDEEFELYEKKDKLAKLSLNNLRRDYVKVEIYKILFDYSKSFWTSDFDDIVTKIMKLFDDYINENLPID